ncbi:fibronectin type III domain-containing protein [Galbibacter sp. PAP.153]|uniref:fibronectin type III domain-containing protein n=1 Tax=Galbibacter sp. PAP.153 TaxID=3104623 RepID=UPI003009E09A
MKNAAMKFGQLCLSVMILFTISCNDDRETLDQLLSDTEAPTVPTGLSASNVKTESLQLFWEAATDNVKVTNYEVFQDGESIGLSGGNISLEISGLMANTSYEFSVQALDGEDNVSSISDPLTVTTADEEDTEKPSAPANLQATNITASSMELSWEASTDNNEVTDYEVFQNGTSIGKTNGEVVFTVDNLATGTEYEFYVVAEDLAGNLSEKSATITATTLSGEDTEAPTVPTNIQATDIASTTLTLTWTASTDNEAVSEYEVFQDDVSIGRVSGTTMEVTGLAPDNSYEFTVQAMDASGNVSELSDVYTASTSAEPITDSVIDIIIARDDLSTLQTVLESTGMTANLEEDGPFTVFAPNNAAFTAYGTLPGGFVLNRLIVNHVVEGEFTAQELIAEAIVTNGLNEDLTITEDGSGNIVINGEAKIIIKDIKATNGIIHIIDKIVPTTD